jgi:hypothetical protein
MADLLGALEKSATGDLPERLMAVSSDPTLSFVVRLDAMRALFGGFAGRAFMDQLRRLQETVAPVDPFRE